jgi:hypothetical protein
MRILILLPADSENIHHKNDRHQKEYSVWQNFQSRKLFEEWWVHEVKNCRRHKTTVVYWYCLFARKMGLIIKNSPPKKFSKISL